jgi:hypothetical protein
MQPRLHSSELRGVYLRIHQLYFYTRTENSTQNISVLQLFVENMLV